MSYFTIHISLSLIQIDTLSHCSGVFRNVKKKKKKRESTISIGSSEIKILTTWGGGGAQTIHRGQNKKKNVFVVVAKWTAAIRGGDFHCPVFTW